MHSLHICKSKAADNDEAGAARVGCPAYLVPGAGVEPARIAPLVFETSASTDSAIRALVDAKLILFSASSKFICQLSVHRQGGGALTVRPLRWLCPFGLWLIPYLSAGMLGSTGQ